MLSLLLVLALTTPPAAPESPIAFASDAIVWADGPPTVPAGTKMAILEGDPRADGLFTIRLRVPAGAALAPHWHPRHERVTILSGAVELGFGSTADRTATQRYGAGSFYVNPPRVMHYLFFPEETTMQITAIGPWEVLTSDIDPRPHAPASGRVTLRSITPAAGTRVESSTTLTAVVDYDIGNFRPDTFHLSFQFESTTPNQTFNASRAVTTGTIPPAPPRSKTLTSPTGSLTVTYPLEQVWESPRLRRPIRVRIYLHEQTSDSTSKVVAMSDWVEYQ